MVFRHTMLQELYKTKRQRDKRGLGLRKFEGRTDAQNSALQCGHWPTMRRTAELQRVSPWSWQRFLAGMIVMRSCASGLDDAS